MRINDLIKELQEIKKIYGNLYVIGSGDSEGNNYFTFDKDDVHLAYTQDALNKYFKDNIYPSKEDAIAVTLWPFAEGFENEEKATKYYDKQYKRRKL